MRESGVVFLPVKRYCGEAGLRALFFFRNSPLCGAPEQGKAASYASAQLGELTRDCVGLGDLADDARESGDFSVCSGSIVSPYAPRGKRIFYKKAAVPSRDETAD